MSHAKQVQSQNNSDPQRFQVVIQIFYNSGSSRAKGLSTSDTSWHEQCRTDLRAMKFPFPPTSSLVCSESESKVQMAWNVRATDHIMKKFGLAFNPSAPTPKETQQKLDSLDIYQMYMLKRWIKLSGDGESLTLAGLVRSSKATRYYHEASRDGRHANASTWSSPVLLSPALPFNHSSHSKKASLSADVPSSAFPPKSGPTSSSSLKDLLLPVSIPPSLPSKPTSSTLPPPTPDSATQTLSPMGRPSSFVPYHHRATSPTTRSITSTHPDQPVGGNAHRGREGGSNVDIERPRKRSSNVMSLDSITINPAAPVKRARIDSEYPPQSVGGGVGHGTKVDDLEWKCTDLEAQLARERKGREVAEARLLRLQQEYRNRESPNTTAGTTPESQVAEIQEQLLFAQGDVEIHKSKTRNLEQELVSKQAKLEAEQALVSRLRQQVDRERREADLLRYETERLKVKNTSLVHDVHMFEQARERTRTEMREMVGARDRKFEELELQVERREQQLSEYAKKLRSVAEEGGKKRVMVREREDKSSSEDEGLKPEHIIYEGKSRELNRLRAELDREHILRVELEGVVEDLRRECRTPFLVPALVDAFAEISKLTTRTKIILEDEKDVDEVNHHLRTASPS